jgi:uncharacterized linocin/CFP29 family protein
MITELTMESALASCRATASAEIQLMEEDLKQKHNIDATPVVDGVYRSSKESDNNAFFAYGYVEVDVEELLSTEDTRQLEQFDYGTQEYDDKLNSLLDMELVKDDTTYEVVSNFQDYLYLLGVDEVDWDYCSILKNFEVEELERYGHGSCWMVKYKGNN